MVMRGNPFASIQGPMPFQAMAMSNDRVVLCLVLMDHVFSCQLSLVPGSSNSREKDESKRLKDLVLERRLVDGSSSL